MAKSESFVEIKLDEAKLRRIQAILRDIPNALPKVVSRGINRMAQWTRTRIVRRLSSEIGEQGLRYKDIRDGVKIAKRATHTSWLSVLKLGGHGIPLGRLHPVESQRGVIYYLGGKHYFVRHGFLAQMESGHKGVFIRGKVVGYQGKWGYRRELHPGGWWTELPIVERFGPAIGTLFERTGQIAKEIQVEAGQNLEKEVDRQVELLLAGVRT